MKWFKHYNELLGSPYMQILLDKHGYAGSYAYMRLLEILAKNLNVETPETFVLSKRDVFSSLFPKTSPKTGKKILDYFRSIGWMKYKIYGKEIIITCNVIKELADEYTRKTLAEMDKKRQ